MKKITTTLVATILFIVSHAQTVTYKVTQAKTLVYNDNYEEWIAVDSTYPSEMYAFFENKKIKITDEAHSDYIVYGDPELKKKPTYVTSKWKAIDEKQRDCIIMLQIINPEDKKYKTNILYVMYKSFTFFYVLEPTE